MTITLKQLSFETNKLNLFTGASVTIQREYGGAFNVGHYYIFSGAWYEVRAVTSERGGFVTVLKGDTKRDLFGQIIAAQNIINHQKGKTKHV